MKTIQEKIMFIAQGNPGAYIVLSGLQWYTLWHEMLDYIIENKWIGGKLWEMYKDVYHQDLHAFGDMMERQIREEMYKGIEIPDNKKNSKVTKAMINKHYRF